MSLEKPLPLITSETAKKIVEGHTQVSLDLGLSITTIEIEEDTVRLPNGEVVKREVLKKITDRDNTVFFPKEGNLYMVSISDAHYFKLVPTVGAPTIEIDGVRMHRTKEVTPEVDARAKIDAVGVEGGIVLDTCTGLGYTAQACMEKGADYVVSIEVRPEVITIARLNPWSRSIFEDMKSHLLVGNTFTLIETLPHALFEIVIHDPPRFAHAGMLYSLGFYRNLLSILRPGGRLFHYTGEPGSKRRGIDLRRGVISRLRQAGFKNVEYHEGVRGVTCSKSSISSMKKSTTPFRRRL